MQQELLDVVMGSRVLQITSQQVKYACFLLLFGFTQDALLIFEQASHQVNDFVERFDVKHVGFDRFERVEHLCQGCKRILSLLKSLT